MEFKYNSWTMFVNEGAAFTETFREEMATQLLAKFYLMLEIRNEIKRHKFHLHVGMTSLETIYKDGYAFAIVDILTPISMTISVTAYWKPNNGENVENASKLDVWNKENIEFGWCTDFDKNEFTKYLEPRNVLTKEQLNSNFDYEYDYTLYPDLSLTICFSQKVFEEELTEIASILSTTIKDTYISELTNENEIMESDKDDETVGIFDFQDNDFDTSTLQLVEAIKKIGQSNCGKLITKIIVE